MTTREERALSQRILYIDHTLTQHGSYDFNIIGSTGKSYTVTIGCSHNMCSCPDYTARRMRCKHIIFVFCRVLNQKLENIRSTYTIDELATLVASIRDVNYINQLTQILLQTSLEEKQTSIKLSSTSESKIIPLPIDEDTPCSICYEDMHQSTELILYCQCRNNFHKVCYERWCKAKNKSCPLCRHANPIMTLHTN